VSRQPEALSRGPRWRSAVPWLHSPPLLLLSGQGVSVLCAGLAVLAIPLLVLDLTSNPLVSGLSAASVPLGYLLVGFAAAMGLASSAVTLTAANLGSGAALVVASLVNRTQRQRLVPRELPRRVTSTVRALFLAVDPLGVVAAGVVAAAVGGDPRPVFLVAGGTVVVAAAGGWAGGLRAASGHPVQRARDQT